MQSGEYTIDVGLREPTEDLLKRLEALPVGARVRLDVPRDAITLRTLEDFNMLRDLQRRQQLQLTIASQERTITGLARIYGLENIDLSTAKRVAVPDEVPGEEAPARPARARPALPTPPAPAGPAPRAGESASAIVLPTSTEGARPVAGGAGRPAITENDWLFNGVVPGETLDSDRAALHPERSPVPPPDVAVARPATFVPAAGPAGPVPPPLAGPAAAPADAELGDLANLNFDSAELDARGAEYEREVAARDVAGAAAPGTRTFVDHSRPSDTPVTVLGAERGRPAAGGAPVSPRRLRGGRAPGGPPTPAGVAPGAAAAAATVAGSTATGATGSSAAVARGSAAPVLAGPPAGTSRVLVSSGARPRRARGGLVLLGVLLILFGLGLILLLNLNPAPPPVPVITATVNIVPKTSGDFGPVGVVVPVMTTGSVSGRAPGLAAPAFPLTGTRPLTATAPLNGTAPVAPTLPLTGTTGPRTALPVQAQKIMTTVRAELVISTTGQKTVPDHSAVGKILVANTSANAIFLPANLALPGKNGLTFHTVSGVTVPGTNFLTGTVQRVTVDIVADAPGPAYNQISLGGSYHSNVGDLVYGTTAPTAGGDTKQVPIVAAADRDALLGKLKAAIDARASKDLLAKVTAAGPDMTPLTCTMVLPADIAATHYAVDPPPDADGTQIHGVMTATVSVYAFHLDEARHQAANAAQDAAPADLPVQAQIDPASLHESALQLAPVSDCRGNRVQYSTQVRGTLVYTFPAGSAIQDQIRSLVAGRSPADARAAILASPLGPYIDRVDISVLKNAVSSAADKVPTASAGIAVVIGGLGGSATTPGAVGTAAPPALAPTATGEPK